VSENLEPSHPNSSTNNLGPRPNREARASYIEQIDQIVQVIKQHPKLVIADDFEIAVQKLSGVTQRFQNGEEKLGREEESLWVSLRLMTRKQPGRAVISSNNREQLLQLVDRAFEASKRASVDPWFRFPLWKQPKKIALENPSLCADVPFEPKSYFNSLGRSPALLEETFEKWHSDLLIHRKSEKFQLRHSRNFYTGYYSVVNENGDRLDEERAYSNPLTDSNSEIQELVDQSFELQRAEDFFVSATKYWGKPFPEKYSLLVSPRAGARLLKLISSWFFADHVQAGRSLLTRLRHADPQVFSKALNILDDGQYPGGSHGAPFDVEGCLTQATLIVEEGELGDYLYDAYAATRENRLSTGNFLRSNSSQFASIAPSNMFILPSTRSRHDLVSEIPRGLFLQSIDVVEPVFDKESEVKIYGTGWILKEGNCLEPVKGVVLTLDLMELFQRVALVGNDLSFFGGFGSPSILFADLPRGIS
jgi:predicted Zn-dependent protease